MIGHPMSGILIDKVCIVTGVGGGIGAACAERFVSEGARVVGTDLDPAAAEYLSQAVSKAGGTMRLLAPVDLRSFEECKRLIEFTIAAYGRIDAIINVAAAMRTAWIEDLAPQDLSEVLDGEVGLVFNLTKAAWSELKKTAGSIVNLASVSGWIGYRELPGLAHSAGKGAVLAMTRHMAMEGRRHGIRANTISPGLIETRATRELLALDHWREAMLDKIMLGRAGRPEEVASAAVFLASGQSSFITGTDIKVDGGTTAW